VVHHPFSHPPCGPSAYQAVLDFKASAARLEGVGFVGDVYGGACIECSLLSAQAAVPHILQS
jgi:hypothetical protein